jgi:CRP-like cAMP-binding protein
MFPEDKFAHLSIAPLFRAIDSAALYDLRTDMDWRFLAGGETLFRAGDAGDSMYVVLSGRLRIIAERSDGTNEAIREIAQGESVGELALLTGRPRSATVRAIRDTELVRISQAAFENAIRTHPQMLRRLTALIARAWAPKTRPQGVTCARSRCCRLMNNHHLPCSPSASSRH